MSDYEDDFENYDDDDFEAEEDYEVLPRVATPPPAPVPIKQAAPQAIAVSKGTKQASAGSRPMHIPQAPLLSDAQLQARNMRLLAALRKRQQIELQVFGMDDMFVMSPLSLYDLACMARGQYANNKVAAVQTNEDAKEEECQTDEVCCEAVGSQVPDDRHKMSEAEVSSASVTARKLPGGAASAARAARVLNSDPQREAKMAAFMQWAGPVMLASLGMAPGGSGSVTFSPEPAAPPGQAQPPLVCGVVHVGWPELLAQRPVTCVALSAAPGSTQLLVAYGPVGAQLGPATLIKDHSLSGKGCLCVWDLSQPQAPQAVLVSEGAPACCAWVPPPNQHVVIAGMEEGGVCAWDLQEPAGRHPTHRLDRSTTLTLRCPAFTSEAHADADAAGPIRSVCCVARQGGGERASTCQVLALSAWGDVAVYSLSVTAGVYGSSAADVDLGVRIGSRVRLMRLGGGVGVRLGLAPQGTPAAARPTPLNTACHCMAVLQGVAGPSSQVLVGSDGCRTLRGSWLGAPPAPKTYLAVDRHAPAATSSKAAQQLPGAVTCLAVSPHIPEAFLAGLSNGSITLHTASQSTAVLEWCEVGAGGVQAVAWSPSRPAAFMALDHASVLHYFDLTQSRSGPILQQPFMVMQQQQQQQDAVPSLTTCMHAAALSPGGRSGAAQPCLVLGYDDGGVDVHELSAAYAAGGSMETETRLLADMLSLSQYTSQPD